jgi:hypothetical protein
MNDPRYSLRAATELTADQEGQWNQLASLSKVGRLYSSAAWSRMVTRSDRDAPTYFLLYEGGQLVAGVTGDLMPPGVPPQYDVEGMLRGGFIRTDLPPWEPAGPMMPCTTVVTRAGRAADFRLAPAASRETRVRQLQVLIDEIDRYGRERGARSAALLFTPHEAVEIAEAAEKNNFVGTSVSRSFYLDVGYSTLDEYFQQFPAKRRSVFRAERRRVENDSSVTQRVLPLADRMDDAARFGALNFAKYGETNFSDVERVRERNQLIVDELGDRARVLELLIDGDVVASLQFNTHDDIYYARLVGILDTVPKSLAVYFNLAFYSLVDLACGEQVKRIVYAQELPGAKTSRGCLAEVQDLWVRSEEPGMPARIRALGEAVDLDTSVIG